LKHLGEDHKKLILTLEHTLSHIQDIDTKEKIKSSLEILKSEAYYLANTIAVFKLDESPELTGTSSQQEK